MNITTLQKSFLFSCGEASFHQTQFKTHHSRTCFMGSEFQKPWYICRGTLKRKRKRKVEVEGGEREKKEKRKECHWQER